VNWSNEPSGRVVWTLASIRNQVGGTIKISRIAASAATSGEILKYAHHSRGRDPAAISSVA